MPVIVYICFGILSSHTWSVKYLPDLIRHYKFSPFQLVIFVNLLSPSVWQLALNNNCLGFFVLVAPLVLAYLGLWACASETERSRGSREKDDHTRERNRTIGGHDETREREREREWEKGKGERDRGQPSERIRSLPRLELVHLFCLSPLAIPTC